MHINDTPHVMQTVTANSSWYGIVVKVMMLIWTIRNMAYLFFQRTSIKKEPQPKSLTVVGSVIFNDNIYWLFYLNVR